MFSTSLRATLIALVAIATAVSVSATPSLSLKVTGPAAVDGVENLKVVATLTNTGDETLKLLNDPNSILSTLPADTFFITNDSGDSPDFIGARAKYSPAVAAASNNPRAATFIAPGTSVSVTHDLSSAYNFTSTGYSTYTIAPSSFFLIANANNEISELHADVESFTTRVTDGKLAVARLPSVTKRATFNGCSAADQTTLNAAASAAQNYSQTALTYLNSHYASTTRYTTWFGLYTDLRHNTVLNHFGNISSNNFSGFSYDCTCTDPSFAYVFPNMFGTIYICSDFWTAPATGTDSQAGTLVHEASHFTVNGGTTDGVGCDPVTGKNCVYGQAAVKAFALSNPAQVILIADAHEYFAENTPALP